MYARYSDRVQFIIIYTIEAHPVGCPSPYSGEEWTSSASTDAAGSPLTQPETYDERLAHASQMVQELEISVPVLIDEMDNPVWCTYGPAPNIAYLIGTGGSIVEKEQWYQPQQMEAAIIAYLSEGDD